METVESSEIELPQSIDNIAIEWKKALDYRGVYIILLGAVMAILLLYKKEQEIQQNTANIKEQMERDYPQLISTFLLYMGAGMTTKNAWVKIVESYQTKGSERYIYQEMVRTYQEMLNGKSEVEAYEDFGQRVDILIYRKFSLLLAQNVKKGTKGMVAVLEGEAQEAFNSRKRKAKSLGEEAGTKLLLPMFLMLAVVLCIIVVPAFLSVQL